MLLQAPVQLLAAAFGGKYGWLEPAEEKSSGTIAELKRFISEGHDGRLG